ncbi:Multidrug resistance-associated protein 1 [Mortierella alpina]|uniref:Multidrug resistance-associated protein 1 n=1 Tax=Mortierella alpina TaxID=64518 RepID=A0A9P6JB86_MORAP|nr:Multidrug resistance-associated protein 1 [Mortierella alpina]
MGAAWALAVVLNHYEHIYEIRSSSAIFTFYTAAIAAALTIIKTALDLEPASGSIIKLLTVFTSVLATGFVFEAWPRGRTQVQQRSGASLYGRANLFSRLTFFFFQPIIAIGLRRPLTQQDIMGQLPEAMSAERGFQSLSRAWSSRLKKHRKPADQPSLLWTILIKDWELLIPVLLSRIAIVLFSYTLPILLKEMLGYLEDYESKPVSYGLTLAVGMFVASLFASLLNTYNRYQMLTIGVTYRAALISIIYRKALRLSSGSRTESTSGEIANHMSVDADVFWDCLVPLSTWITIPIEIFIAMRLLYGLLGWTMLAGVLAMLLMLPLQAWQARIYESMQHEKLKAMDQRIRLTTEVLGSMKIVKLYGWSSAFLKRILSIRQMELEALRKLGIVQAFMSIVFISSSLIISLITFAVYALWGGPGLTPGKLTPQTVFVSMTLFAMLKNPISSLSDATTTTISLVVATRRIQQFLMREEVNEQDVVRFDGLPGDERDPVISLVDATFSWTGPTQKAELQKMTPDERTALLSESEHQPQEPTSPTLSSINLAVGKGSLTAVVGRVGQGKSSLLSAIIGDMYKLAGRVQISGRVAYVPQQAWITNASLRDNILFGTEYNEARYKQVLCACGLEPDLAMFPAGDATEIGERGINLSGGQKQRVSLARAAYADAHIYLLDDPLSAVDAHVDRHLWDELLGPSGLLKDKTRVLVTHGIHHLQEVDQIVVLKDGLVAEKGTYVELMAGKKAFYRLIKDYTMLERRRSHSTLPVERRSSHGSIAGESGALDDDSQEDDIDDREQSSSEVATDQWTLQGGTSETVTQQTIQDEKKDTKAALIPKATLGRISSLPMRKLRCLVSTSLWLRHWIKVTKSSDDDHPPSLALFLGVYGALTFVYVLIYVVVMWLGFAVARIQASEKIHARLLDKILRLPISFFDTTPLGRIINRFSSDIVAVDIRIPNKLMDVLLFGISVSSTLLLIVFTTPTFTILLPFLIAGYWFVQMCFLGVSRILVRIYSVSKSPVYQYFNESLDGVSTIRAMGISDRFAEKCVALTDRMSNNFLSNMSSRRWLDVQLRLLSTIVLLCAAVFAVLQREHLDPSLVGLSLSFALTLTEEVTTLVRNFCDLQNQLVCLERVLEYTELRTEAPDVTDVHLPPNWPAEGRISFHNYSTRYREGLDLVIKNVTLVISPAEKVGIVGRTGAGKSSLTLALFRIVEAANSYWARESDNSDAAVMDSAVQENHDSETQHVEEEDGGRIDIDGVDISTVGLQQLRQHLSIIPQDPTLFAGTVRDNLDPFQELDDAELWQALERSHLKTYISMLPGGLHFEVSQNGENFSVGQRSLICLARALLRKTKILVMDEATAAVDVETDELIQRTIRTEFKDRTILTIAHRIKTVMDSDKILVLERGRVQEFDSPSRLLEIRESLFYRLAHQAGEA